MTEPRALPPLVIPLHYDFASSLCYVTHRVTGRLASELARIGIELAWTPLDLAGLLNWRRGARMPEDRRSNAERVARELEVPLQMPPRWLDSRDVMAAALARFAPPRDATWRERVFTAIFEEGRDVGEPDVCAGLARELGEPLSEADLESGRAELEARTREAAASEVIGVPTFMLDRWPFGGIQDDTTMLTLFERFAHRVHGRPIVEPGEDG